MLSWNIKSANQKLFYEPVMSINLKYETIWKGEEFLLEIKANIIACDKDVDSLLNRHNSQYIM